MAVMKVIELLADSSKGWEDATQIASMKAAKTVKNIKSVYVAEQSATVDKKGKITRYRVNVRVTFQVGSA